MKYENIIINNIMYFILLYLTSLIISKYHIISSIFSIVALFILCSSENISKYTIFSKVKGLLTFFPLLYYANYKYLPAKFQNLNIITFLLAINILEVSILLGLNSPETLSKINGINLFVLALFTPKMIIRDGIIGFKNNILWGICFSSLLTNTYLFNDFYFKTNWRYAGIYSHLIPTIHSLITNNTQLWVSLRVYSLITTFLIMLKFPQIHKMISEQLNNTILWSTDEYDKFKYYFTMFNTFLIINLIYQNTKNGSFLNF